MNYQVIPSCGRAVLLVLITHPVAMSTPLAKISPYVSVAPLHRPVESILVTPTPTRECEHKTDPVISIIVYAIE